MDSALEVGIAAVKPAFVAGDAVHLLSLMQEVRDCSGHRPQRQE
ncbi:hypothetical protein NW809_10555 [Synechococcus sp. WC101]